MISKTDICNMALAHLGQEPISSLKQDDEKSRRCNLFYEPVKREVLRTHNWAFAGCIENLSLLPQKTPSEWPYMYAYPQDCLFIRRVFGQGGYAQSTAFKEIYQHDIHARVIFSGISQAQAEYTQDVKDEGMFDPAFVKTFSLALAADLAVALTGDGALAQRILQKYTLALDEARRCNMTESFDIHQGKSSFWEAR
ncbi:MAG: hypothetical protein IKL48_01365 [Elusimicrobiaceae bacterium]|nr:hypothetical protein [Elusimicrobiaceae bacterium]